MTKLIFSSFSHVGLSDFLMPKAIDKLKTAAAIHQTEYHAGLDLITDKTKDAKTSHPNKFMALFLKRIDGRTVKAT